MEGEKLLTGNQAASEAARLARIEVFPAFPITPSYPVMTYITGMIDQGRLDCRFIRVESDHSALAAGVGSSLAGARTFSVTNSQGLAMMHEVLHYSSGLRLPIVMAVVNRALSAPHCRFADHGDAIAQETTGWIQLFCENNQEVLDTVLQAFKIAEDDRVLLPVMVNYEGYILGEAEQPVNVPYGPDVDSFLPAFNRAIVDTDAPAYINPPTAHDIYSEYKYQQNRAMETALEVMERVSTDFARLFDRNWSGAAEPYETEGAETLIVTMGSMVATAREAVDAMRGAGKRVGLLKVRSFRPFPFTEVTEAARQVGSVIVIDRNIVFGTGGALYRELLMALAAAGIAIPVRGYVAGLGGREVTVEEIVAMAEQGLEAARDGRPGGEVIWPQLKRELVHEGVAL